MTGKQLSILLSCCLLGDRAIKFVFFDSNGGSSSNENNIMDIVQQAIDYDVAIEIIAKLRSDAIRRKHAATTEEERQAADAEIKAYNADESVLNGYGSDDARTSVYDKVFRFYGPLLREMQSAMYNGLPRNIDKCL